jgi:hypothetical protein
MAKNNETLIEKTMGRAITSNKNKVIKQREDYSNKIEILIN